LPSIFAHERECSKRDAADKCLLRLLQSRHERERIGSAVAARYVARNHDKWGKPSAPKDASQIKRNIFSQFFPSFRTTKNLATAIFIV
jgi:hypothetical protein